MALRWKMKAARFGLSETLRGSDLRDEVGSVILTTACVGGSYGDPARGWYWYGMGMNTSNHPLSATEAEARVAARAFYDRETKRGQHNG